MTIYSGPVFSWRSSGLDWNAAPYEDASPNLVAIEQFVRATFGGGSMGIHHDRPTSSNVTSEHSWGAAFDWGTGQAQVDWMQSKNIPHGKVLSLSEHFAAVDWIVAHSAELHVQSIVDIGRSWRSDRTDNGANGWKPYSSGYTGHCHIVTTFDGWGVDSPVAGRLTQPSRLPIDLIDMSRFNSIKKNLVPNVPLVHQTQILHGVDAITVDPKFHSRMSHYQDKREILGGYVPLVGGSKWPIDDQMRFHFEQVDPYWRPGWFSQIDVEPWEGKYPVPTIDELAYAMHLHSIRYGRDRLIVYMNPNELPSLWRQFTERFPDVARWVPDYSPDGDEQARRRGATIHQWSGTTQPVGFSTDTPVNQIINPVRFRQIAGLELPEEPDMTPRYFRVEGAPRPIWVTTDEITAFQVQGPTYKAQGNPPAEVLSKVDALRYNYVDTVHPSLAGAG